MKRNWMRRLWAAALCILLLAGCSPVSSSSAASSAPAADPLTGLEPEAPGQRPAAVIIDNSPGCTTQWGIGSASVVLEAATDLHSPTSLCLVYPSVEAMPTVGPWPWGRTCTGSCFRPSRSCRCSWGAACLPGIFWTTGTSGP